MSKYECLCHTDKGIFYFFSERCTEKARNTRGEIMWVIGCHVIHHFIRLDAKNVKRIVALKSKAKRFENTAFEAKRYGIRFDWVQHLPEHSDVDEEAVHQGIMAEIHWEYASEPDWDTWMDNNPKAIVLVLDQVQDPHNMGACLRNAAAFGVSMVVVPKTGTVGLTPSVFKVSSGAAALVPMVQVSNLARTLKAMKKAGIWLYAACESGDQSIHDADLSGPVAWLVGAEGRGLRELTRKLCDQVVTIPTSSRFSCLNMSVATGVGLYEIQRQRATQTA